MNDVAEFERGLRRLAFGEDMSWATFAAPVAADHSLPAAHNAAWRKHGGGAGTAGAE